MESAAVGGGVLDPGGAMEQMRAWKGRIDKLAADTKAMSDRLQELRVTVQDENGLAEVTVDSTGALLDLRLGRHAQRVPPDVLARTIMDTLRRAKGELADRSQQIIAETVGTESAAARAIAERVHRRLLPDPEPDEREPYDGHGWRG
ncbi:YbaB/EbfC family nucleoid-associated protein [Micromonospora globbae]|jgi:DNA-binding protein YbaB|uniref:YbaB/EbfC family nucleoid-associated protein n=1 Tax=Micromonospora globbae TaxID=1894969 RepID=A0ABZ1SBD5_9ACTN|nr:YbaB/EbfC family nucleoid-associated protein [Micromonospora globbae]WTF83319.1 YbaB/EbfC family nucleoid-associated protein [Micromonospora globbae]